MAKEKTVNPVQAQRKAEKAKAIKKSKAEVASRRNEKLARRNPDRLQKQLDELEAIESSGGRLTHHEKNIRQTLEKELRAVRKARDALGDPALKTGTLSNKSTKENSILNANEKGDVFLGKRKRDYRESSDEDSDVPEDVKHIPMPRDTPPPIPREILDQWYQKQRDRKGSNSINPCMKSKNSSPTDDNRLEVRSINPEKPITTPKVEAQTVYEAKPVIRNLRKEAVAFIPTVVRVKLDKAKGVEGLIEPEEAEELEKTGYLNKLP